jgi:hypothetical protein
MAPPLKPVIAITVDSESDSPDFVPDSVPPLLLKSVVLLARAKLGNIMHDSNKSAGTGDLLQRLIGSSFAILCQIWEHGGSPI